MPRLRSLKPFRRNQLRQESDLPYRRKSFWSLNALESRLMLAGDAGAAVAEVGSQATDTKSQPESQLASQVEIVVLDSDVEAGEEILQLVRPGVEIALIDANADPLTQID